MLRDKLTIIDWNEIRNRIGLSLGKKTQKEIEKTVLSRLKHIKKQLTY